nr:hypothetical protein [Tanacetum cinerariifolium]
MKCGKSMELRHVFADVVSAWIAKGMSEGLKYEVEHRKANLDLEAIEAYDPEAETKYVTAIHALRDLKYLMEAKLLKKSIAQVARRDQRIWARENEKKNLEALLEAETDMKKATKAKNTELGKELENLRSLFSDLQVSNDRLSQQVSSLQAQVTGEEKLKAAFEEFKNMKMIG